MRYIHFLICGLLILQLGCKAEHDFYHAQYAELAAACRKSGGIPMGAMDEFGRPHLLRCEVFPNAKEERR